MKEKEITVNGNKISLFDEGHGAPILFVHGLGGYKENWEENLDYFIKRGHRVIAIDQPGFGHSEKRAGGPYGIEFYSDTLCAMLDQLGIAKAHWVGNSMGGHVAAFTAIKHPERIDKLVLVDAAGTNTEQIRTLVMSNQAMLNNPAFKPTPELVGIMLRTMIFFGPTPQADKMVKRAIEDFGAPDADLRQQVSMLVLQSILNTPLDERLNQIKAPTLVIWGKNDNLVNVSNAKLYGEGIKGAKIHLIESCGHCPMLEKPENFNRTLGEFLG